MEDPEKVLILKKRLVHPSFFLFKNKKSLRQTAGFFTIVSYPAFWDRYGVYRHSHPLLKRAWIPLLEPVLQWTDPPLEAQLDP